MATEKIADWVKKILQEVESLIVYVNSAKPGVKAPAAQMAKPSFSLSLSHFYDRPLQFSEDQVKADLLFEKSFATCIIPWSSIWAAHPSGDPQQICLWNDNSPGLGWDAALLQYLKVKPEILSQQTENLKEDKPETKVTPKLKLSVVEDSEPSIDHPEKKPKVTKARRANLKLVK